jgi:predicted DNA-binding protein with PD1-like motif
MGFYTGRSGSLVYSGKKVAKIRDWSVETTVELLSTNSIDSTVNTFAPGVKGATGSATLMYYRLEPEDVDKTEFTQLLNKIMQLGKISVNQRVFLELNVAGGEDNDIKFNAYITSAQVSVSTGELSVVPIQFTMDGDFNQVIV